MAAEKLFFSGLALSACMKKLRVLRALETDIALKGYVSIVTVGSAYAVIQSA